MSSPVAKRPFIPPMSSMSIGTHDGSFHCDEALACFLLKQLPEFANHTIVRTRDAATLEACDIVVDVGGVYDAATKRFDHHQRSFVGTMHSLAGKPWTTRLSSAGLVYLHFGQQILERACHVDATTAVALFDRVYEDFIEEIDAVDNGVNVSDGPLRYKVTSTISNRVKRLSPDWNEPSTSTDFDAGFAKAMQLVGSEFLDVVRGLHTTWMPARSIVEQALVSRFDVDVSGEIVVLPQYCPWQSHLFALEPQFVKDGQAPVKFVLYGDTSGKWRIQAVPLSSGSFDQRLGLPEPWRGIRDQALSDLTGIPECIFVHANGFIGGAVSQSSVLAMARQTLALASTAAAT